MPPIRRWSGRYWFRCCALSPPPDSSWSHAFVCHWRVRGFNNFPDKWIAASRGWCWPASSLLSPRCWWAPGQSQRPRTPTRPTSDTLAHLSRPCCWKRVWFCRAWSCYSPAGCLTPLNSDNLSLGGSPGSNPE